MRSDVGMGGSRAAALAAASLLLVACPGSFNPPVERDGGKTTPTEAGASGERSSSTTEGGGSYNDLTSKAGGDCIFGKCGGTLVCLTSINTCVNTCTAKSSCDSKSSSCASNEACLFYSTFTDACYPVSAKYLENCNGQICETGTLCVQTTSATKCLRLCTYKCPSGVQCVSTNTGCQICYQ